MTVDIRWKAASRSPALEEHLERRLRFALGRFAPRVRRVRALLEDVNGPRGGVDKRCAIAIQAPGGSLRVEVRDSDFYVAVDRAADAAARKLARAEEARRAFAPSFLASMTVARDRT